MSSALFLLSIGFFLQLTAPYIVPTAFGSIFFFPAVLFFGMAHMPFRYTLPTAGLFGLILDSISSSPIGFHTASFLVAAGGIAGIQAYVRTGEEWMRFLFVGIGLLISSGMMFLLRLSIGGMDMITIGITELLLQGGTLIILIIGKIITRQMRRKITFYT